jgi:hypothetical protein
MNEPLIARSLLKWMLVPVLLLWGYHLAQRRYAERVGAKRMASLLVTVLFLAAWIAVYAFILLGVPDVFLLPLAAVMAAAAVWQRRRLFPYRWRCPRCSRPLSLERILFQGNHLCETCEPADRDREKTS